ncbi:hypothetical protein EDD29_4817 [Actinocorallia herbida]|uniref:Uncharacterized protein n=1 Tax=Actinocorallia herbida TaxID=58109 RepID=A0A3N1D115_9ACTN|nr:hypothetical protein [Actinocorallia herbida]ROO87223.1 hypothetical protein EDD29_4817 [Actinocorallia herbida]
MRLPDSLEVVLAVDVDGHGRTTPLLLIGDPNGETEHGTNVLVSALLGDGWQLVIATGSFTARPPTAAWSVEVGAGPDPVLRGPGGLRLRLYGEDLPVDWTAMARGSRSVLGVAGRIPAEEARARAELDAAIGAGMVVAAALPVIDAGR